jgi:outer membrane protein assembly factor BamB
MGFSAETAARDLVEVLYPVFDGHIYRLDLATGKPTRDPIAVGFGFKGTGSIDPRGYPLFYQGQGLNDTNGRIGAFQYRMFDLVKNKQVFGIPGSDPFAFRTWGAFDSSAIVEAKSDTLIEPAENGIVYKVALHSAFDPATGQATLAPTLAKFRYRVSYHRNDGMESSAAYYRNLMYVTDNGGTVLCLDINRLEPVWMYDTKDDSDATTVLEETADGAFLYRGNTVDKRCKSTGASSALCNLQKFDALTGKVVWQYDVRCVYDSVLNGGMLATPLLGKGDIADLAIFNIAKTTSKSAGELVALDRKTGKPVWSRHLAAYSWSSPIAIQGDDGKSYGVFCDSVGDMHLFDPRTGQDLDTISLGLNVESSPAAYGDMIVVASYAQKIFGIHLK